MVDSISEELNCDRDSGVVVDFECVLTEEMLELGELQPLPFLTREVRLNIRGEARA
jgi:uncharacterized ParB-like nuclease family protein